MKSIVATAAAIIVAAAALAIATPGDAATPRSFDAVTTTDAAPAVEYIAFEPMEITAQPAIVMEPLIITVDSSIASDTIVMEPMHIVASVADLADATPVPAL